MRDKSDIERWNLVTAGKGCNRDTYIKRQNLIRRKKKSVEGGGTTNCNLESAGGGRENVEGKDKTERKGLEAGKVEEEISEVDAGWRLVGRRGYGGPACKKCGITESMKLQRLRCVLLC